MTVIMKITTTFFLASLGFSGAAADLPTQKSDARVGGIQLAQQQPRLTEQRMISPEMGGEDLFFPSDIFFPSGIFQPSAPLRGIPGDSFAPAQLKALEKQRITTVKDLANADTRTLSKVLNISPAQARSLQKEVSGRMRD